jgi:acetyl esterase
MDFRLNLMMMLPESFRMRMIGDRTIERDGRTMSPAMQMILYILEKRRITKDIENIGAQKIRDFYDTTAGLLQKRPPRMKTVDHQIDLSDDQMRIREYIPKNFKENDHSMLYFHGGGFSIGSIRTHDPVCKFLSEMLGWKIFSVEYRLAPEHRFPVPLEDCDKSMDWLIENADQFEIDINKIAVGGDSAGGNLAACLCIKRIEEGKIQPERQILFYPAVDTGGDYESIKTFTDGYFLLTKELLEWFGNNYLDESDHTNIYAAPMNYDKLDMVPPALIITAGFDPLRDEGKTYAEILQKNGVKVDYKEYPSLIHGFLNFTIAPECMRAMEEISEKIKSIN